MFFREKHPGIVKLEACDKEKAREYLEKARDLYQEMGIEYYASIDQASLESLQS